MYVRGQAVDKDGTVIDDSNTEALWLWDSYEDKFVEKIYENPKYDVGGIAISDVTKKPVYISYYGEKPEKVWLDKELEAVYSSIEASFPNDQVSIGSWTDAEDAAIVTAWSDTNPGEMYYYDRNKGSIALIAKSRPWIKKEEMSPMLPISFTARDGLVVEGYLTVPKNSDGKNLPLIINPHGGPASRDVWGYNPEHQFFASRGYAVLSMNFRGSTGYGRSHVKMANGQWGRKMQDDVTDSVNWAVEQGIADPDNVCIYGASYGGYATMAGITLTPELYRCAVNYVGIWDIKMLYEQNGRGVDRAKRWFHNHVLDPKEDVDQLKKTSPNFHLDKIQAPLLIVHGRRDYNVRIEQAETLMDALDEKNIPYEVLIKKEEGHGFRLEENRVELYTVMEKFFEKNLSKPSLRSD